MKAFHRLTAWLGRKSRTRERRKLFRKIIELTQLREEHPERRSHYTAELRSTIARLDAIALAEDTAGVEARIKPSPLWPGLPTEGARLRVVREGQQ